MAGFTEVPVDFQSYQSESDEMADMIADNKIAELAETENDILKDLLQELDTGEIDLSITGFDENEIGQLMSQIHQEENDEVAKDDIECPSVHDLIDTTSSNALIHEIQKTDLPPTIKDFLCVCAMRHQWVNYDRVAKFYQNQNETIKKLMRDSALVNDGTNDILVESFIQSKARNPLKITRVGTPVAE